jgi:hypothetical protein
MAQVPLAIAAPGETVIATFHAEGAQIYECKADNDGKLNWVFREPIATLLLKDKTVGRHYAGPTWELTNGSAITGKEVGAAPGADKNDVPWLKLAVVNRRGSGLLADVTTVQRINTHGGAAQGACDEASTFDSVAYAGVFRSIAPPASGSCPIVTRTFANCWCPLAPRAASIFDPFV